jgi:hypothetical protein
VSYLEDIANYLHGLAIATLGTDLFIGQLHDDQDYIPNASTVLIAISGPAPIQLHSAPQDAYDQPGLQVRCRGAPYDFSEVNTRIHTIYTELQNVLDTTLGSTRYLGIRATGTPMSLGPDDQLRPIMTCSFQVIHCRS